MDWKLALVKNYKKMDLNENELSMIFVVDSLLQDGETVYSFKISVSGATNNREFEVRINLNYTLTNS